MKKITGKRGIDCVAMKRRAQAKIYGDIKGSSVADQIAYFRQRAKSGKLGAWWQQVSSLADAPLAVHEKPSRYGK